MTGGAVTSGGPWNYDISSLCFGSTTYTYPVTITTHYLLFSASIHVLKWMWLTLGSPLISHVNDTG